MGKARCAVHDNIKPLASGFLMQHFDLGIGIDKGCWLTNDDNDHAVSCGDKIDHIRFNACSCIYNQMIQFTG